MGNANLEDYLQHWGIKGMKWGRRRYQNKDGSLTPAGKARYGNESKEAKEVRELRATKKMSEMTNAELQRVVTRMNLERQYTSLTAQERQANKSAFDKIMSGVDTGLQIANKYNQIVGVFNSAAFKPIRDKIKTKKG